MACLSLVSTLLLQGGKAKNQYKLSKILSSFGLHSSIIKFEIRVPEKSESKSPRICPKIRVSQIENASKYKCPKIKMSLVYIVSN